MRLELEGQCHYRMFLFCLCYQECAIPREYVGQPAETIGFWTGGDPGGDPGGIEGPGEYHWGEGPHISNILKCHGTHVPKSVRSYASMG